LVDAHHHLWDTSLYPYPRLTREQGTGSAAPQRYVIGDYLNDTKGWQLVKSVHVEAAIATEHAVDETRWLQATADKHGFPHGIVAFAPLHDPDVKATLSAHAESANMRGIRQMLDGDSDREVARGLPPDYLHDAQWRKGYQLLREFEFSFDLQVRPEQMSAGADLADEYPNTPLVLNHSGLPDVTNFDEFAHWRAGIRELALRPNVFAKISGFGMLDRQWTLNSIRPFVLETIDAFGLERCMFASNFPIDKMNRSFDEIFGTFFAIVGNARPDELRGLFHDNAVRVYRL
jgi:predicted TIM-barrel fold metal-dependent hydrolase